MPPSNPEADYKIKLMMDKMRESRGKSLVIIIKIINKIIIIQSTII